MREVGGGGITNGGAANISRNRLWPVLRKNTPVVCVNGLRRTSKGSVRNMPISAAREQSVGLP